MSILANQNTRVVIQGITGRQASFHLRHILSTPTNVVAGVTKNTTESSHLGVALYESVKAAVEATGANASLLFVPAPNVKEAVFEAIDAGIKLIVSIAYGVPILDVMEIQQKVKAAGAVFLGPNTPGIASCDEAYLGIFDQNMLKKGRVGIVSRSSTLTYEAILETNLAGLGQSTVVGLGDDMIAGASFEKMLELFEKDEETDIVVLIGALGGTFEEEAALCYQNLKIKKPLIVYITGLENLEDDIGYASDILTHGKVTVEDKKQAFRQVGAIVLDNITDLHKALLRFKK
ncbi:MAG: succinate--CoA ligase subunit alpha [Alphaproteobacteria bacterium]|nr:succinate--CoA ligase subunit alpha [Alphaproteobacteria bacterium]